MSLDKDDSECTKPSECHGDTLNIGASLANARSKIWIVRQMRSLQPICMLGPLSIVEIKADIRSGKILYSDLIWKEGDKKWTRIAERLEILDNTMVISLGEEPKSDLQLNIENPSKSSQSKEDIQNQPTQAALLTSVNRVSDLRNSRCNELPKPVDAQGEDLVGTPDWMKLIGKTVFLIGIFAFGFQSFAGSVLEIVPLKLTTSMPSLVLETDIGVGEKIAIEIHGASGEILDLPSLFRRLVVSRNSSELPSINLAEQKLPPGTYRITATLLNSTPELKKELKIFIGNQNDEFKVQLGKHAKNIASQQQNEKFTFFYMAKELSKKVKNFEVSVQALQSEKRVSKSNIKKMQAEISQVRSKLENIGSVGLSKMAYPEHYETFKAAVQHLSTAVNQLAQNFSIQHGEKSEMSNDRVVASHEKMDLVTSGRVLSKPGQQLGNDELGKRSLEMRGLIQELDKFKKNAAHLSSQP